MKIISFSPFGYEGALVHVEVDLRRGIPAVDMVGLADGAVKESRERMRSAIRNSGFAFPPERVLISLSPADLKKEGAGFDLAIALAVLAASQETSCEENAPKGKSFSQESILVMGELELNGNVRPVRGIHAAVSTAKSYGINKCIVPSANLGEALEVKGIKAFGASTLIEAFSALSDVSLFAEKKSTQENSSLSLPKGAVCIEGVYFPAFDEENDLCHIKNQARLVRALQIAASGRHNLLAFGPPGCGKTLALQRYHTLLPLLTDDESHSVTRIHSLAGLLPAGKAVIRTPPFRQPHQTASVEGMCGGGIHCMPGEVSLSHNGTLFLDEAAEFRSSVLQMLRVPLETGNITLSRAGRSTTYPARFQLLMATNPCPCGFYGSRDRLCLCSAKSVELYWKKFSGPLLDRMDIRIAVDNGSKEKESSVSTEQLRVAIAKAVRVQRERQGKPNSYLNASEIKDYCINYAGDEAKKFLERTCEKNDFSQRARASCLKLARTIADMRESSLIELADMEEAVSFRREIAAMEIAAIEMLV